VRGSLAASSSPSTSPPPLARPDQASLKVRRTTVAAQLVAAEPRLRQILDAPYDRERLASLVASPMAA
jgi:hypothetical protein